MSRTSSNGNQTRLDEFDKIEWFATARIFKPGLTEMEYSAMWDRFQADKAAYLKKQAMQ